MVAVAAAASGVSRGAHWLPVGVGVDLDRRVGVGVGVVCCARFLKLEVVKLLSSSLSPKPLCVTKPLCLTKPL